MRNVLRAIGATDRKGAHDWQGRSERVEWACGLTDTFGRPSWFDHYQTDLVRLVRLQGNTRISGTPRDGVTARSQLLRVLEASLWLQAALCKTFELHAQTSAQQTDLEPIFVALYTDQSGGLDRAHDLNIMPLDQEPRAVRDDLEGIRQSAMP